ncbi:bifunctional peptidase and (3S)-lysyl hydroxylase Jmjd7-like [Sycon ciliatum]|uniref:bifunctional peptidase and (3S)-lysyl hydroxylase Jmjd7-like n=1 Tax=Sycon ciliatum TaxID=27933 RepID=UPI0031F60F96
MDSCVSLVLVSLSLAHFAAKVLTVSVASAEEVARSLPEFPPSLGDEPVDSPPYGRGHLKPFGYQRAPEGPVQEYIEELHPSDFYRTHIKPKQPLVYRGMVSDSPAFRLWTDEYLRETYGSLDVISEVKNESRATPPKRMQMREFLDRYQKDNLYIVTVLPDDMRKEVKAPRSVLCGSTRRFIQEANLWMSNGGTRSVIHYDADHNIHCLLAGRKDFVMIPKKYQAQLYMASQTINGSGYSLIDPDSVDLMQYPLAAGVPWTWATLAPGDCIFLPGGYLHQVRSYTRSISETLLFTPTRWFNDSNCNTTDVDSYMSLADVELKWTYLKGQKHIEMGYMNPELIRESLFRQLTHNAAISRELFMEIITDDLRSEANEFATDAMSAKLWLEIKSPDRDYLTYEDVENAPLEALKNIARAIDPPHDTD